MDRARVSGEARLSLQYCLLHMDRARVGLHLHLAMNPLDMNGARVTLDLHIAELGHGNIQVDVS